MTVPRFVRATDATFSEAGYLGANPDVAAAVEDGVFANGLEHFETYGRHEDRLVIQRASTARLARHLPAAAERAISRLERSSRTYQLDSLASRVRDLEVYTRQQDSMLRYFHRMITPPPKHLQERVVGRYTSRFIDSSFDAVYPTLAKSVARAGRRIDEFGTILDFGSGCGRALIALARLLPNVELHGTDIDPEAIAWCQANYAALAAFVVAPHEPPLPYPDMMFDFVFGISVMTHLPETMQFAWLADLRRITRPEGLVLLTTHGANYHARLDPAQRKQLDNAGFLYIDSGYGQTISLPDFYQTAMHTETYIRERWSEHFDVIDIDPVAYEQHQDIVLLRRR
ncbi:MAG: methyltransferase domain-containing protein [Ilumatobacteraceae bacterium]